MSLQAIDSLKHFAGKANELQLLRDRVQELEELLGLSMEQRDLMSPLKLSPQQTALLGLIYRGNLIRRTAAYTSIFGARLECEQPDDKILDVQLSRLRAALKPRGITIETHRGVGWSMSSDNKERLRTAIGGSATR